ncbi:hypothetical protein B7486_47305 [cyanobacterium TDX16]|nr:hypothetical protein B7486_47305 [cyanobacterium TDX16]
MENIGISLGEYVKGKIYSGIKTGFNKAFIIDGIKRAELIAKEPQSAEILKPLAVGKDIRRWLIRDNDRWLIFTRRGIKIDQYPAVKEHLEQWRKDLTSKQGSLTANNRKTQQNQWYEIQDTVSYYQAFEAPKIIYPDIAEECRFAFDTKKYYLGNTVYFIAKSDLFLIAILNSSIVWNYCRNNLPVLGDPNKGERLRFFRQFVEKIPIPTATESQHKAIESLVGYVVYLSEQLKDIPSHGKKLMEVADDKLMLSYFEQIIDAVVTELYLPSELHAHDKQFIHHLLHENLQSLDDIKGDKMQALREVFRRLFDREHPIRVGIFFLDSIPVVRTIRGVT